MDHVWCVAAQIEVFMDDLEAKAREFKVFDLTEFYGCAAFNAAGFVVDTAKRTIKKTWV